MPEEVWPFTTPLPRRQWLLARGARPFGGFFGTPRACLPPLPTLLDQEEGPVGVKVMTEVVSVLRVLEGER